MPLPQTTTESVRRDLPQHAAFLRALALGNPNLGIDPELIELLTFAEKNQHVLGELAVWVQRGIELSKTGPTPLPQGMR